MARGSVDRWRRWLIDNGQHVGLTPTQIDALAALLHAALRRAPSDR